MSRPIRRERLLIKHAELRIPRNISRDAHKKIGVLLNRLQQGERLRRKEKRPMPRVGPGCYELKVASRYTVWRVIYFDDPNAIVLLEVHSHKAYRRAPARVIQNARSRLEDLTKFELEFEW